MNKLIDYLKLLNTTSEEVLTSIQVCINAYNGKHGKVKQVLKSEKLNDINGINVITGYTEDGTLCIGFRGTTGDAEWINNFDFYKTDIPFDNIPTDIEVHLGFIDRYRVVRTWLLDYVGKSGAKKILFTGHSLGATTSTYACIDIAMNFPFIEIKNIVFGSPRSGNKPFREYFNTLIKNSLNFRYRNDIVSRVPPEKLKYKHIANFVWLAEPSLKDKILHPIRWIKGFAGDHDPVKYLNYLKDNFKKI